MNWYRALYRLWVGGSAAWILLLLVGSMAAAFQAPQTNDARELLALAAASVAVALFGAWVLRGLKGATR